MYTDISFEFSYFKILRFVFCNSTKNIRRQSLEFVQRYDWLLLKYDCTPGLRYYWNVHAIDSAVIYLELTLPWTECITHGTGIDNLLKTLRFTLEHSKTERMFSNPVGNWISVTAYFVGRAVNTACVPVFYRARISRFRDPIYHITLIPKLVSVFGRDLY